MLGREPLETMRYRPPPESGGAHQIMLQQFRRAVGVAIMWGNIKQNLGVYTTSEKCRGGGLCEYSASQPARTRTDMLTGTMPIHQMDMRCMC